MPTSQMRWVIIVHSKSLEPLDSQNQNNFNICKSAMSEIVKRDRQVVNEICDETCLAYSYCIRRVGCTRTDNGGSSNSLLL